jgi:hypothetical protein
MSGVVALVTLSVALVTVVLFAKQGSLSWRPLSLAAISHHRDRVTGDGPFRSSPRLKIDPCAARGDIDEGHANAPGEAPVQTVECEMIRDLATDKAKRTGERDREEITRRYIPGPQDPRNLT